MRAHLKPLLRPCDRRFTTADVLVSSSLCFAASTGKGGRLLGFSSTLSQHLAKKTAYDPTRDQDPREAILKFADVAESDPYYVAPAYEKNAPEPVFDMRPENESDDEDLSAKKRVFDPFKKPT
eukprot:m.96498 g.96498  ORF g.96498 m.96498 type:complete len:123 (-) comp15193_c0_seq1:97-465(-)